MTLRRCDARRKRAATRQHPLGAYRPLDKGSPYSCRPGRLSCRKRDDASYRSPTRVSLATGGGAAVGKLVVDATASAIKDKLAPKNESPIVLPPASTATSCPFWRQRVQNGHTRVTAASCNRLPNLRANLVRVRVSQSVAPCRSASGLIGCPTTPSSFSASGKTGHQTTWRFPSGCDLLCPAVPLRPGGGGRHPGEELGARLAKRRRPIGRRRLRNLTIRVSIQGSGLRNLLQ